MPNPKVVNLDALIKRADLNVSPKSQQSQDNRPNQGGLYLEMLKQGHTFFSALKKPDFQRETCSWGPEQIINMIANHLDNELIPSVILWRNELNEIFVIDGAHRMSALIAWVNDDYGNGPISQEFFGKQNISDGQREMDAATRALIEEKLWPYSKLASILSSDKPKWESSLQKKRANAIGTVPVSVQPLGGLAKDAEEAFVRINQGGVRISPTEAAIIRKRDKPEGIAARALLRAGSGYAYWKKCKPEDQLKIVDLAKEIDAMLYEPESNDEIYSAIPMAGKRYTVDALGFLFHLIQVANQLLPKTSSLSPKQKTPKLNVRDLGQTTVQYLARIRDLLARIFSKRKGSLGLHPAVYCRSATGRFQPSAFYAQIQLVQRLETEVDGFHEFVEIRESFEEFLVKNKSIVNEIVRGKGASTKSLKTLSEIYLLIYDKFKEGNAYDDVRKLVFNDKRFSKYLTQELPLEGQGKFSQEAKAAINLRLELENAPRCPECRARMHLLASTADHIEPREKGGSSHSQNGARMHPFCNDGVKERRRAAEQS
ncbi:MAG TPA: DUF262 domain-containing protein [Verrucomicrobiae bacterium]|jgi:hypothetical protein